MGVNTSYLLVILFISLFIYNLFLFYLFFRFFLNDKLLCFYSNHKHHLYLLVRVELIISYLKESLFRLDQKLFVKVKSWFGRAPVFHATLTYVAALLLFAKLQRQIRVSNMNFTTSFEKRQPSVSPIHHKRVIIKN